MYPRLLILLLLGGAAMAFRSNGDCKTMHQGRFTYMADKEQVLVIIKDSSFTEVYGDGKEQVKAKIEWLSPCEYNLVITKVTVVGFSYKPGDEVNVKIDRIEGKEIFYTTTVNRISWQGRFTKISD